jgi:hypothetical protein
MVGEVSDSRKENNAIEANNEKKGRTLRQHSNRILYLATS